MSISPTKIADVVRRDSRYAYPAYLFIFEGLEYAQDRIDADEDDDDARHVTGQEMLEGVRALAIREFGLLAWTVFRMWGIRTTDDVGEIVFNLIDAGLLSKHESDDRADFHDLFAWDQVLGDGYEIGLEGTAMAKAREA